MGRVQASCRGSTSGSTGRDPIWSSFWSAANPRNAFMFLSALRQFRLLSGGTIDPETCRSTVSPFELRHKLQLGLCGPTVSRLEAKPRRGLIAAGRFSLARVRRFSLSFGRSVLTGMENSVQNFPDSGGKQRPIVSTLVHAIIRLFGRSIWGVAHGFDCRDPASSFGEEGEYQFDRA